MEREITPFPFVKCSPSNCMIYGFIDKYFKMNVYDETEFDKKMKLLEKEVEKANKNIKKGKPTNKRKCSRAPIESTDEDHDRDLEHTKTLFEQAKKEGRAEGKKEVQIEAAQVLISHGDSDSNIVRITSLTLKEVQEIRKSLKKPKAKKSA